MTDEAPCGLETGVLTMTATPTDDAGDRFAGSTSEFSENEPGFPGSAPCETATATATDTPTQGPPTDAPAAVATTTPPTPATATPTETPSKICGDVDMDTFVNSVDASLVLQLKVGLITSVPNPSNADVDADTFITSVDADLILQADIGIIGVGDLVCL